MGGAAPSRYLRLHWRFGLWLGVGLERWRVDPVEERPRLGLRRDRRRPPSSRRASGPGPRRPGSRAEGRGVGVRR